MIEVISLFVISAGALLVTIASIFRLAWLAVIIPVLIAGAAAFGLFALRRRGPRRASRTTGRPDTPSKRSQRMAA
ncbi:MAG TPA: hypothetical protein VIE41_20155 [Methylomirabilota bacterium]|jgi:hypothetical protein